MPRARTSPALTLASALACVSSGALLIRLCESGPFAVAFWRLALAALIPWTFCLVSPRRLKLQLGVLRSRWSAAAGLFLALHLVLWITSLGLTSVAASTFLLGIQVPLSGLVSWFFLSEAPGRRGLTGLGLSAGGLGVLALGEWHSSPTDSPGLHGNLLALLSGAAYVAYLACVRKTRASQDLPTMVWLGALYSWAALAVVGLALLQGGTVAAEMKADWLFLVLLALFPTLGGHGLFNHALTVVRVYTVNLVAVAEPVVASALAWLFLAEAPSTACLIGAPFILLGAVLALRESH